MLAAALIAARSLRPSGSAPCTSALSTTRTRRSHRTCSRRRSEKFFIKTPMNSKTSPWGRLKQKIQQWEQRWSERSSTMPRDTSASQPTSPHPQGSTDNEGDRSDSEEESESGSDDSSCSYDFTHRHGRFYTDDPREEVFSKLAKQISTQPDMDDTDGRSDQEKSDHKEYRLEDIPVLHLPCTTAYQCRFCGQYFSFKGTKALHEQKCVRRQLSNVKRRRRRLDNDSATDDNDSAAQLKTVYTCEDCGIEVSAQTKLNRHKKFYCPFRESAFSDPFLDAVGQTSKRSPIPENEIDSNAKVKDFEVLTGLKRQREDSTSDNDEEYEYIYVPTDSEDDGDEDSNGTSPSEGNL
ncbi:hypothetical protein AGDE_14793 [Angomonas deanei]|nr:hypothetical protein AGDE_14793 [Angomonas deanei]|eukprot:EPY20217.1 hypothetical protein AGDE_14793 [Angomonas deanei]